MTAPTNVTFTTGTTITSEWLNGVNDYVNELDPADHSAANVTYNPPFTNAVATTVENKLAEIVNVEDFINPAESDQTQAFIRAAEYLLSQNNPGGTIQVTSNVTVQAGQINFWDILVAKQGLTPPYNYLPNGELVRGTQINLQGQGFDKSTINVTGSGDAFTWGYFINIGQQRAMTGVVQGISFNGPGAVGSTSQTIIAGVQGFSTTTSATAGTTNTDTTCLSFKTISPGTIVRDCRFRYFQEAINNRYGFGFVLDNTCIQYCNIGVHFGDGCTTWNIRSGCEIEVCGVGVYSQYSNNGVINNAVIEANFAGCDVLLAGSRFIQINNTWFEGSLQNVVLRGSQFAPSLPNAEHTYYNVVGLNIDNNGGVQNLTFNYCNMNLLGETYAANTGETFSNVVYNNCVVGGNPFDLSSVSVSGIATINEISIIGDTVNSVIAQYGMRDPLKKRGCATIASTAVQTCFTLSVPNIKTTARVVITATKTPATYGTYRTYLMRYVGYLVRTPGNATVWHNSSTDSFTEIISGTGTTDPVLVATPTVVIAGSTSGNQAASFQFATGTPVSDTATTVWDLEVYPDVDGIYIVS